MRSPGTRSTSSRTGTEVTTMKKTLKVRKNGHYLGTLLG
jgi:hypothetical protein